MQKIKKALKKLAGLGVKNSGKSKKTSAPATQSAKKSPATKKKSQPVAAAKKPQAKKPASNSQVASKASSKTSASSKGQGKAGAQKTSGARKAQPAPARPDVIRKKGGASAAPGATSAAASSKASDKSHDKAHEKTTDKHVDRTAERSPDKAADKTTDAGKAEKSARKLTPVAGSGSGANGSAAGHAANANGQESALNRKSEPDLDFEDDEFGGEPELDDVMEEVVEAKAPVEGRASKAPRSKSREEPEPEAADEEIILTDAEGRRYCRVRDCDQSSAVDGYCRYHYLLFWKNIQNRKKILSEGKLERYIEELTARYPDKYLEMLRKDLRSEKEFLAAIQELEIDESGENSEFEDEAQNYLDEVRGMSSEASSGREEEDF